MTRCPRCGRVQKPAKLPPGGHHDDTACYAEAAHFTEQAVWIVSCRDIEVASLRNRIAELEGEIAAMGERNE